MWLWDTVCYVSTVFVSNSLGIAMLRKTPSATWEPSFCYLCRAVVKDYTHFCQQPHCTHEKCGVCPLWTKDLDAEHEKNMREAALAEAKRVEAEASAASSQRQTKKAGLFGQEGKPKSAANVNIDVDSILQAPKRRRAN